MAGSVLDLGRQLLRSAHAPLLDASLDHLGAQLDDEDVRDILRDLAESGNALTLREALTDDALDRWVAETCTQREEDALCLQLQRWLGHSQFGDDDPPRLVSVDPIPDEARALTRWAARYALQGELLRPAHEVLHGVHGLRAETTLSDCCLGHFELELRSSSLLAGHDAQGQARDYLDGQARQHAALAARKALWEQPLGDSALRPLGERLRAMLSKTGPEQLHGLRFVPARPVSVDLSSGVVTGHILGGPDQEPVVAELLLSGFEQRALSGRCSASRGATGIHVMAVAGRLLDAVLLPEDRLHEPLLEFVGVPSWERFVRALQPTAGHTEAPASGRLTFRVRLEGHRASVGVFHAKPTRSGGWSKGKQVSARRALRSQACRDHDRAVLEALSLGTRTMAAQYVPADLIVLRSLVEHPHVQLEGQSDALRVSEQALHVEFEQQADGLKPHVSLAGTTVSTEPRPQDVGYLLHYERATDTLVVAALTPPLRRLLEALHNFQGILPPQSFRKLAPWLSRIRQVARVTSPKALQGFEQPTPRKLLLRITPGLDEGVDVSLSMRALPLSALWPPGQGPQLVHGLEDGAAVHTRRDLDWERVTAAEVLETLQLHQHMRLQPFTYRIEDTQAALQMLSEAAKLADRLHLEWSGRARSLRIDATLRPADLKVRFFKQGSWWNIEGKASSAEATVAVDKLLHAARRGERFVKVTGDSYAEIEQELFERLRAAQLCAHEIKGRFALGEAALPFWLARVDDSARQDPALGPWLQRAALGTRATNDPAPELDAHWQQRLRDYQQQGSRWLLTLARWAPGACLADEMGLGKTIQTLAVLDARRALGPALVVAPTSVVPNWLDELQRFAPDLRGRAHLGPQRDCDMSGLGAGDVVVTSYELLLRDIEHFTDVPFATQVIDEAQLIKNARTRRAQAVARVDAGFRIALSGTPVENRLGDLWSLFALISPGLLGPWQRFRAVFAVPIERYGDDARAADLRALIAPFVLRRSKRDVASELPARTDVTQRVELSDAEQDLYNAAATAARSRVRNLDGNHASRSMQVLAELTRLRQLACHPRLVLKEEDVSSSKTRAVLQLLRDVLPRGHRALVFSQFTQHLQLVRQALQEAGIESLYLDGATPSTQRKGLVDRFQQGQAPVFLISLKAGGTGLNLTAADYVVHLDPWWNPASEDQASDRAHRLGQQQPVTVVRMVAQGTIEERVLALHKHKRALASQVLSDGTPPAEVDLELLEQLLVE